MSCGKLTTIFSEFNFLVIVKNQLKNERTKQFSVFTLPLKFNMDFATKAFIIQH